MFDSKKGFDKEKTITYKVALDSEDPVRKTLSTVYEALIEKGYNPLNQLVGYILTEDPTYITNHNNARGIIRRIDRDDLMAALLKEYLQL